MNERDLKVTCKEIKEFDSLIQWQIVEFVRATLYGSLFIHLPSATFNQSIRYFRYAIYFIEAVKITFIILEHILHLLDTYLKNSDCEIFNCIEYLPV